jgi:hypothetical protein
VVGLSILLPSAGSAPVPTASPAGSALAQSAPPAAITPANPANTVDSTKVVQTAKTPPKPAMSDRAAIILAYNKLPSACPKADTLNGAKSIAYAVHVDVVHDRPVSDNMAVSYDVCGLLKDTPFLTSFTLTKLHQRGLRQQKPYTETAPETANSPRSHEKWKLETKDLSAGDYRLDVVVTDGKKRQVTTSREFKIIEKQ